MAVNIRKRALADGSVVLYLDMYLDGKRHYENLHIRMPKEKRLHKEYIRRPKRSEQNVNSKFRPRPMDTYHRSRRMVCIHGARPEFRVHVLLGSLRPANVFLVQS